MEPALAALGRFVADTRAVAVPTEVRAHGALVIADTVGAILGGSAEPELARLRALADGVQESATVLGPGFPRAGPWRAIVTNGTAGTALELDEGHRFARGHPAIHVVPAALAEAERRGASGSALLDAVVLGYDVAARLGAAGPVRAGMHVHGVHGTVGAAAAVARLRGVDRETTARALAVAAGLTLATAWRTALEGATVRNAYAGVAGATGWLSVDLASAGFTGLPDMLSETFGRQSGAGFAPPIVLDGLGTRFEITRNYFKRHACCRYNHGAIEALEAILGAGHLAGDRIERIRVWTYAPASTMSERDPRGSLGAKFSIPYALAARITLGASGPDAFREPALSDPRVRALARRVEVIEEPAMTARLPAARPARVEVELTGGGTRGHEVGMPAGEFDRPYPRALLRDKFLALAAPVLGRGAEGAWTLLEGLDDLKDARELGDRLRALTT